MPSEHDRPSEALKRRRKIWSCLECRRRKLQCDRELPTCGRCLQSGDPSRCKYLASDIKPSRIRKQPVSKVPASAVQQAGAVRLPVDRLLTSRPSQAMEQESNVLDTPVLPMARSDCEHLPPATSVEDNGFMLAMKGNCTGTVDQGKTAEESNISTNYGFLMNLVPGLSDMTRLAFVQFPALDQIRREIDKLEMRWTEESYRAAKVVDADLTQYLPPRSELDSLVESYFWEFNPCYPIFESKASLEKCIESVQSGGQRDARSVALLLLISSASLSLRSTSFASRESQSDRCRATLMISACRRWLDERPSRFFDPQDLRIRFLLLLTQLLNYRRYKHTYTNAGKLLRDMMCSRRSLRWQSGPGTRYGPIEREARQNVWRATVEFELQAAFEQGLPPLAYPDRMDSHSDYATQTNSSETSSLSVSQLSSTAESLRLRKRLCSRLNTDESPFTFQDAKAIAEELETHIVRLSQSEAKTNVVSRALFELNLRQFLLALHERQLRHAYTPLEQRFHRAALVENSISVVDTHRAVIDSGHYVLELLCCQQARAALTIAGACLATEPGADRALSHFATAEAAIRMRMAVDMVRRKVVRYSGNQRQLWAVLAAEALVKIRSTPEERDAHVRTAVDTCVSAFQDLVVRREDVPGRIPTVEQSHDVVLSECDWDMSFLTTNAWEDWNLDTWLDGAEGNWAMNFFPTQ